MLDVTNGDYVMNKILLNVALVALMAVYYPVCLGQNVRDKPQHRPRDQQSSAPTSGPTDDSDKRKVEAAARTDKEKSSGASTAGGATRAPTLEGAKRYLVPESK